MFIYTLPYTDENYSVDIKNKILLKNNIAIENSCKKTETVIL
jgi:hypothetical protein